MSYGGSVLIEGLKNKVKHFFGHRCNQYHLVEILTQWGESKEEWILIREAIPCQFIQKKQGEDKKNDLYPIWSLEGKLLLPREILLEKGDLLEICGFFGKPIWVQTKNSGVGYLTHQEIFVAERDIGDCIG